MNELQPKQDEIQEKPEPHGILVIDKPPGPTSYDCIRFLRRTCGLPKKWKIGHLGTLDPFATGVMVIALGQAVRYAAYAFNSDKEYRARLWLGEETDTLDFTGKVTESQEIPENWRDRLESVKEKFTGKCLQVPPQYSAKQVDGKRSYKAARKGEKLELKAVEVEIYSLEFGESQDNWVDFTAKVSGGTYIRSLGRDIAKGLGTLGYLIGLERTASGPFKKEVAIPFPAFELGGSQVLLHHLKPVDVIIGHIPLLTVKDDKTGKIKDGKLLTEDDFECDLPTFENREMIYRIYDNREKFLSLGRPRSEPQGIIPFKPWLVD